MKDWTLLVWITQLGLNVASPLLGFVFVGVWLQKHFHLGTWIILLFSVIGFCSAFEGLRTILKNMDRGKKSKSDVPAVSFNEHA